MPTLSKPSLISPAYFSAMVFMTSAVGILPLTWAKVLTPIRRSLCVWAEAVTTDRTIRTATKRTSFFPLMGASLFRA